MYFVCKTELMQEPTKLLATQFNWKNAKLILLDTLEKKYEEKGVKQFFFGADVYWTIGVREYLLYMKVRPLAKFIVPDCGG